MAESLLPIPFPKKDEEDTDAVSDWSDLGNVKIRLNAAVRKIQRFGHGVSLTLLTGEETPLYDFCIVAVPLGARL